MRSKLIIFRIDASNAVFGLRKYPRYSISLKFLEKLIICSNFKSSAKLQSNHNQVKFFHITYHDYIPGFKRIKKVYNQPKLLWSIINSDFELPQFIL